MAPTFVTSFGPNLTAYQLVLSTTLTQTYKQWCICIHADQTQTLCHRVSLCFITVPASLEVCPKLSTSSSDNMAQPVSFSEFIFRTGSLSSSPCERCSTSQYLCIVYQFSSSCGLCLRDGFCCSFHLARDIPVSTKASCSQAQASELRQELSRTIDVLIGISSGMSRLADEDLASVQTLGLSPDRISSSSPPRCCLFHHNHST